MSDDEAPPFLSEAWKELNPDWMTDREKEWCNNFSRPVMMQSDKENDKKLTETAPKHTYEPPSGRTLPQIPSQGTEYSPLHHAAAENDENEVHRLLEGDLSLAWGRDELGGTPLHVAAYHSSYEAAKAILKMAGKKGIAEVMTPERKSTPICIEERRCLLDEG